MLFPEGFKLIRQKEEETFILAYGSNLLWTRMESRCPSARVVGVTILHGYRMLFKQSLTGAYATIEQDANSSVPAVVYRISAEDEAHLDRREGYPKYYYKRDFFPSVRSLKTTTRKRRECIAYIMHENRLLGEPTADYVRIVEQGYEMWDFDKGILRRALFDSIGYSRGNKWLKEYRRKELFE